MRRKLTGREPGQYAKERYHAGLSRWRRRMSPRWLMLFGPIFLALLGLLVFGPRAWREFVIFLTGGIFATLIILFDSPPAHIDWWLSGSEAERRTAKQLKRLDKKQWVVKHDVQRGKWNWDHVVVGPSGVFLIDTKQLSGSAELLADGSLQVIRIDDEEDSYVLHRLHGLIKQNARELSQALREKTGLREWVTPVVALWNSFPQGLELFDKVVYLEASGILDWLRNQPAKIDDERRRLIADALTSLTDSRF